MDNTLKNSRWRVIIWSLLDSGNNVPFIFMMTYFLTFTDFSYGISAIVVGAMMGLSRILDGFTDPIIGVWIDKLDTKYGKYRPALLVGAVLLDLSLILMYAGIQFDSELVKIIFIAFLYVIHIIGYTFVTAAWKSGNTIITTDPKQRSMQGLYMTVGTMIVAIMLMAGVPVYFESLGGYSVASGWQVMGVIVALAHLFFTLLAVIAIWNRDNNKFYIISAKKFKFSEFSEILKENKPLRMLILAASTNKLASTTVTTAMVFWYVIIMQDPTLQSTMSLLGLPISILAAVIATIIAVKKSKRYTMLLGSWASIIAISILVIFRPFGPDQVAFYVVIASVMAAFNTIANAQTNVMIADTADYELWKTGKSIPGMISTTFSFIDKLVSSLSGFMVGTIIGLFAYVEGNPVSPALYWSMIALYCGVPFLGHVASIIALKNYELDREMNLKIAQDLQQRKTV